MHAKISSTGSRFFAHDTLAPTCPSLGETPEHREFKRRIASTLRALGCHADIEATPASNDHGGWRADVLGTSPGGRRVAFEIQLAPLTIDERRQRTSVYARDAIQCVWITPRHAHWLCVLPSCRITALDDGRLVVDRGLARLDDQTAPSRWLPTGPVDFTRVALGLLQGRVTTTEQRTLVEITGDQTHYTSNATLLVSTIQAQTMERSQAAQEARQRLDSERKAALYERQARVLQRAIDDATAAIDPGRIKLGVPPKRWDATLPVERTLARGSDATGGGAAIWAEGGRAPALWAVVCPITGKANPSLGRSWKRRGVRVYAETRHEAQQLAAALGWPSDDVTIPRGDNPEKVRRRGWATDGRCCRHRQGGRGGSGRNGRSAGPRRPLVVAES